MHTSTPEKQRRHRWLVGLMLALLGYVWFMLLDGPVRSMWFACTVPREFRRLLGSGTTLEEVRQYAGGLSMELEFEDSHWLAIRYRDSHAGSMNSYALARFSDGTWMESNHHFCGAFAGAKYRMKWIEELDGMGQDLSEDERLEMREASLGDLRDSKLGELVLAKNLGEAKAAMVRLGFKEIAGPP